MHNAYISSVNISMDLCANQTISGPFCVIISVIGSDNDNYLFKIYMYRYTNRKFFSIAENIKYGNNHKYNLRIVCSLLK